MLLGVDNGLLTLLQDGQQTVILLSPLETLVPLLDGDADFIRFCVSCDAAVFRK